MSVVSIVVHDTYALIMSDTKLSDNPRLNTIKKIFKKENILLGFTGNVQDIYEYLFPIFNQDMTLNKNFNFNEPHSFLKMLDDKFYLALEKNKQYDIVFVVGAKIGNKYIAKRYCLTTKEELHIASDMIISSEKLQYFYLGKTVHLDYFDKIMSEKSPCNLNDIILLFKETLDYGISYDNTINNSIEVEYINANSM